MPLQLETSNESKMRSTNRILVLKAINGKGPKSSMGLLDNRLFTGGNNLHAVQDLNNCLWYLQYSNGGVLPPPLKIQFTSFQMLLKHARDYFKSRNVEISEVID